MALGPRRPAANGGGNSRPGPRGAASNGRTVSIDMTGVETGGVAIPEGDYLVEVTEVTVETGASSGQPYLKWKVAVADGQFKGASLYHQTSLQPQALFKLKASLIALGVSVPNSLMNLNLDSLAGKTMGVTVEKEMYEGKAKSKINEVFPWDDAYSTGAEEAGNGDPGPEYPGDPVEEGSEETIEVDTNTMTLPELLAFATEYEIDLSSLKPLEKKNLGKVKAVVDKALEEASL